MKFSEDEVASARRLKTAGLAWQPSVGHFVWDENGLIEAASPFHDRVFFILDLKHFLRRSGTIAGLVEACVWLPTWFDAREILSRGGVPDHVVARRIAETEAIENNRERSVLYEMIAEHLSVR